MKKIVIILNGGLAIDNYEGLKYLNRLISGLEYNFQVTIMCFSSFSPDLYPNAFRIKGTNKFIRFYHLIKTFRKIKREKGVDRIHSFWGYPSGFAAYLLGKIFKTPYSITFMGEESANLPELNYGYLRNSFSKSGLAKLCSSASFIVGVSQHPIGKIQNALGRKFTNFYSIPIGIPYSANRNHKTIGDPIKLLYVGNLHKIKGIDLLFDGFEKIQEHLGNSVELTIIGGNFLTEDEILRFNFIEKIKQNSIQYLGQKSNDYVNEVMKSHTLLIIPSFHEGQSLVFTEAMSNGLPTVSTNVGLMVELENQTCLICKNRNAEEFASLIVELVKDNKEYERLSKNCLDWAKGYTLNDTLNQYKKLFNNQK